MRDNKVLYFSLVSVSFVRSSTGAPAKCALSSSGVATETVAAS